VCCLLLTDRDELEREGVVVTLGNGSSEAVERSATEPWPGVRVPTWQPLGSCCHSREAEPHPPAFALLAFPRSPSHRQHIFSFIFFSAKFQHISSAWWPIHFLWAQLCKCPPSSCYHMLSLSGNFRSQIDITILLFIYLFLHPFVNM
jgi:hypothetical protein